MTKRAEAPCGIGACEVSGPVAARPRRGGGSGAERLIANRSRGADGPAIWGPTGSW